MNKFFEAVGIALSAIWANKLRSFMTVLGNIVAVTSIIAVVTLIQGMNVYVTNAVLSGVGADNFTIQRAPVIRTQEDEERIRNNPRLTMVEAQAVRKFSDNISAVAGQANASAATVTAKRAMIFMSCLLPGSARVCRAARRTATSRDRQGRGSR